MFVLGYCGVVYVSLLSKITFERHFPLIVRAKLQSSLGRIGYQIYFVEWLEKISVKIF